MSKLTASFLLGTCALAAFYYMFLYSINDFLRPTEKKCFGGHPAPDESIVFAPTGIKAVDQLACFGSAFFASVIASPSGLLILREFCAVAFPAFLLMAIESQREGAGGLMLLFPLHAFLCVGVAYGVAFPLIWVVGYWWRPKSVQGRASAGTRIGDAKMKVITIVNYAIVVSYVAMSMPSLMITSSRWLTAVMMLPVLMSPLFYLTPQGVHVTAVPQTSDRGDHSQHQSPLLANFQQLSHPRIHVFATFAGVSAVMHIWAVLDFLTTPGASLLPAILNSGVQWRQEHFLVVDITMCTVGCAAFVLMEAGPVGGVKAALEFVALAVLFGPGAAFAHCLQAREMLLVTQEVAYEEEQEGKKGQ